MQSSDPLPMDVDVAALMAKRHCADGVVTWVALAIGLVLLAVVVVAVIHRARFMKNAVEVRGQIVDYVVESQRHRDTSDIPSRHGLVVKTVGSRPVIEFVTQSGRKMRFVSSLSTRPDTPENPLVLYDPSNPEHAQQKHFFVQTGWILVLAALGAAFTCGGIAMLLRR